APSTSWSAEAWITGPCERSPQRPCLLSASRSPVAPEAVAGVERAAERESGRAAGREHAELDRVRRPVLVPAAVHVARPHPADHRNPSSAEAGVERTARR